MTVSSRLEQRGRELSEALGGLWSKGKGMVRCPAHDDRTPSLGLRLGSHAILLHCFAGCTSSDVLQALERRGIPTRTLFDGSTEKFERLAAPDGPDANADRAVVRNGCQP
jgi:putative DNA primase/helicase